MKRRRHLPTVAGVTPCRSATILLAVPAAHANTNFARKVNAAGIERERAIDCNCCCSSALNFNSVFGRPIGMAVSPASKIPKSDAIYMPLINGTVH
jgi:hypothetical protein